jgi:TetR/AcrR family transcriptional repressor of bet genes
MTASAANGRKPRKERKENADMRRRQILDAAFRSVVENGLARTTLATVADGAGLSQGVAVFYFKSKAGILSETMRDLYQRYEAHWTAALDAAGSAPAAQLRAIIEADFDPAVCNPDSLTVWFAFMGEQKFVRQYAEISAAFENRRSQAVRGICTALSAGDSARADLAAEWIETLTDGYWQKLHLFPDQFRAEEAVAHTLSAAGLLFPASAGDF